MLATSGGSVLRGGAMQGVTRRQLLAGLAGVSVVGCVVGAGVAAGLAAGRWRCGTATGAESACMLHTTDGTYLWSFPAQIKYSRHGTVSYTRGHEITFIDHGLAIGGVSPRSASDARRCGDSRLTITVQVANDIAYLTHEHENGTAARCMRHESAKVPVYRVSHARHLTASVVVD
jgi:hypothetical protein